LTVYFQLKKPKIACTVNLETSRKRRHKNIIAVQDLVSDNGIEALLVNRLLKRGFTVKQILATAFISFGVIALLAAGGFWFIQREAAKGPEAQAGGPENSEAQAAPDLPEAAGAPLPDKMTEARLQFYLHEMTHSKVYAEDKWGAARLMTPENIEELLAIVEASDFNEKAFYRNTLEDWKEGDFSGAVDVHNTIWHWHRGSVGKATRLMTQEEEQAYIRSNF
jgi:hypothetical protein